MSIPIAHSSSCPSPALQYFGLLTAVVFVLACIRSLAFTNCVLTSADTIHVDMFKAVIDSPKLFFESNPLGRVLNRFSNDLDRVDNELPKQGMDTSIYVKRPAIQYDTLIQFDDESDTLIRIQ